MTGWPGRIGVSRWRSRRRIRTSRAGSASLYNNVGWDYFDAGEYEVALNWFERALVEREKRPEEPTRIEHARDAVEEARRMLEAPPA